MRTLSLRALGIPSLVALAPAVLGACSSPSPAPQTPLYADPAGEVPAEKAKAAAPGAEAKPRWENPGGMWMPEQLLAKKDELSLLGFTVPAEKLADPTQFPLGAVIWLGGCSASFVSAEGLVITNHHCVTNALQVNSTPEKNLMKEGFVAANRGEEKSIGPAGRIYVTLAQKDVTKDVREGLDKVKDDAERYKAMEDRQKKLVSTCEKDRPGIRCRVSSFFEGASFRLVEQLEIRDVRLVHAPPEGIGNYGGEIDNWRWPRHVGDYGFYRAYVGADGKPADYSPSNVPYKPPHRLTVAKDALQPGDAVMVAGYPAVTDRLKTAKEVDEAISWDFPKQIAFCETFLADLNEVSKKDPDAAIKARPLIRGLDNWLTNNRGQVDGLVKGGLAKDKAQLEKDLQAFIDADPARKAKAGDVLAKMAKLRTEDAAHREADWTSFEAMRFIKLLSAASTSVQMAEERSKADDKRDPSFQERNWKQIEQGFAQMSKTFHPVVEKALFFRVVKRELALAPKDRFGLAEALIGKPKKPPTDEAIKKAIDDVYAKTKLADEKARIDLFRTAKTDSLKNTTDPMVRLAVLLRPKMKAKEDREKKLSGAMSVLRPIYVEMLREKAKGNLAPDANRTLRVTYGTVRGYRPTPSAPIYTPFTTLSGVVAKHKGEDPFDAPKALRDAAAQKRFGKWVDARLGEVPVDFLSDLDITGGNSGSATLNARGELVGLAFDGNYEAMASDWIFIPEVTRTIHVDIRYVLWVMDAVVPADHLLKEMGVVPSVD
jgi:hypothetical protein